MKFTPAILFTFLTGLLGLVWFLINSELDSLWLILLYGVICLFGYSYAYNIRKCVKNQLYDTFNQHSATAAVKIHGENLSVLGRTGEIIGKMMFN